VCYPASALNDFGEYELATNVSNAVVLTFEVPPNNGLFLENAPTVCASIGVSSCICNPNLSGKNNSLIYPFLGSITEYANNLNTRGLNLGSLNYAYLGGVLEDTVPGPVTVREHIRRCQSCGRNHRVRHVEVRCHDLDTVLVPQWDTDACMGYSLFTLGIYR
jgi:hypothetical protein